MHSWHTTYGPLLRRKLSCKLRVPRKHMSGSCPVGDFQRLIQTILLREVRQGSVGSFVY